MTLLCRLEKCMRQLHESKGMLIETKENEQKHGRDVMADVNGSKEAMEEKITTKRLGSQRVVRKVQSTVCQP